MFKKMEGKKMDKKNAVMKINEIVEQVAAPLSPGDRAEFVAEILKPCLERLNVDICIEGKTSKYPGHLMLVRGFNEEGDIEATVDIGSSDY